LVHFGNGLFGCGAAGEGDESEAAGALGSVFHGEEYVGYFSECSKGFAEFVLVGIYV
jgi:hypothetical protein